MIFMSFYVIILFDMEIDIKITVPGTLTSHIW